MIDKLPGQLDLLKRTA